MAPFLGQADATIANVATPTIQADLHASSGAVVLVVGGYLLAYATLLITGARLGQTHGYKRMFILGGSVFGLTALIGGLAPNVTVLVIMRVLQGAGAALMFPQALTGIQLNFTGAARMRAIGFYAIGLSVGAVVGQIQGGVLISADIAGTGWRAILLINVPVVLIVLAAAVRYLPPDQKRVTKDVVDFLGVGMLSVSLLLVMLPLTLGRDQGWPIWTWVCLIASVPAFWLFTAVLRRTAARGRTPLINLHVLAAPAVSLGLLTLLIATGTYYALLYTLAQYFQHGLGHSALESGLILVPWVAAFGLAGQVTRRLPTRFGPVLPFVGCTVLTLAYVAVSVSLFAGLHNDLLLIVLLGVGGFGLGSQFSTVLGHLTNAVSKRYAADISGVSTTTIQIGGAIGVAAFGAVYLSQATSSGVAQATHAFAVTTACLAGAALIAAVTAWFTKHSRTGETEPSAASGPAPVQVETAAMKG